MPTRGGANVQLLPVGQPHGSQNDMEVLCLPSVTRSPSAKRPCTLRTWTAEIASVVEEMELPADMTYRPRSGRNK